MLLGFVSSLIEMHSVVADAEGGNREQNVFYCQSNWVSVGKSSCSDSGFYGWWYGNIQELEPYNPLFYLTVDNVNMFLFSGLPWATQWQCSADPGRHTKLRRRVRHAECHSHNHSIQTQFGDM